MNLRPIINWKIAVAVLAVGVAFSFAHSLFWSGERMDPECLRYYTDGAQYLQQGQYSEAIMSFLEVIKRNPNYSSVYYHLGLAYDASGDAFTAIQAYKKAIEIKPLYVNAHVSLGNAYDVVAEYPNAARHYEIALKLNPRQPEVLYNLGLDYIRLNKSDEARETMEKAKALFQQRNDLEGSSRVQDKLSQMW